MVRLSAKDQVLKAIRKSDGGMTKEEIMAYFDYQMNQDTLNQYLHRLKKVNLIRSEYANKLKTYNNIQIARRRVKYIAIEQVELDD